jgi:hypothetical protein
MMTTFTADEFVKKKFFDSDFGYATLKMPAGFGRPFSATSPKFSMPDIADG